MANKENSADIMQREKFAIEKSFAKESRICDIIITVLFCLFIGGFTFLHIITPDRAYSENENRALEKFPEFSSDAILSGDFAESMTAYLSDQFPLRDTMVKIRAYSEKALFRMENGGIIFGDDSLTARLENPNLDNLDLNLASADKFASTLESQGLYTMLAVSPRRIDICINDIPSSYGVKSQVEVCDRIKAFGETFSGTYVDIQKLIRSMHLIGDEVYYRTDHHWTPLGAYYAYTNIWKSLPDSMTASFENHRGAAYMIKETVTEDFLGTSYAASGAFWVTPDKITLYRYEGDDTIPVKIGDTVYEGLYRREYLEGRDKYSLFLGENTGRVDIGYGNRQKIVIIKDSFANSVVPFLAADFDIVMIDPRYFSGSIYRTVIEENPDAVLILMNADTLTSDDFLKVLERGID